MTFKLYDILSSLIPGFLLLIAGLELLCKPFNDKLVVAYTAIAFLLGYIVNASGSWLEDFYELTWRGKPSDRLLRGDSIPKVKFYHSAQVRELLSKETTTTDPKSDELFLIAQRSCDEKDVKVEDLNASYAFSRSLLTSILVAAIFLLPMYYWHWQYWVITVIAIPILWVRCKQRSYYYAREVLTTYLRKKAAPKIGKNCQSRRQGSYIVLRRY